METSMIIFISIILCTLVGLVYSCSKILKDTKKLMDISKRMDEDLSLEELIDIKKELDNL